MSYYVPAGNWTKNVVRSLGDNSVSVLPFEINFDSGSPDPAAGCQKDFTATYMCGANTAVKSLRVTKPADGQLASFDCAKEAGECNDLKLTLTDDGKLTLSNAAGTKTFWDSVTAFGANGSIPTDTVVPLDSTGIIASNAPLTVPEYAGNGMPSNLDIKAGGGPGRRYPNNYLLSGQFLEYGQWIGSPSGTCRLMMGTPEEPNSLQVVKTVLACGPLDGAINKPSVPSFKDAGCWRDTGNRALSGPPQQWGYNVESCKQYAIANGSNVFALQAGSWCTIGKPGDNYKKYGAAQGECPANGGGWVNHVYEDTSYKPKATSFNDLGCWKDNGVRALTSYTGAVKTVEECKAKAISQGASTFGVQNGNECWLNKPGDNYQKYGTAPGSCPTLGGPWVNHVFGAPDTDVDSNATRLYTIPDIAGDIGKVGYVNSAGQLQLYPDSMTIYDTTTSPSQYEKIGNYSITESKLGAAFNAKDPVACQTSCSNVNGDTQKCAGFVFDTTTAMCQLLDNTLYDKKRIINDNKQLYMRRKGVKGQDISCPVDVTIQTAEFWSERYKKDSQNMSPSTKCGLAKYTEAERDLVESDLSTVNDNLEYKDHNENKIDAEYDTVNETYSLKTKNKNRFKYIFESLQDKYHKLTNELFNTKSNIESTFDELQDSRQKLADWTGEQLQNLEAMNEDRDLNMMSQNYRHIMWSILAIIIIMSTMKIAKSVTSGSAI
jgi:hypothetical protein